MDDKGKASGWGRWRRPLLLAVLLLALAGGLGSRRYFLAAAVLLAALFFLPLARALWRRRFRVRLASLVLGVLLVNLGALAVITGLDYYRGFRRLYPIAGHMINHGGAYFSANNQRLLVDGWMGGPYLMDASSGRVSYRLYAPGRQFLSPQNTGDGRFLVDHALAKKNVDYRETGETNELGALLREMVFTEEEDRRVFIWDLEAGPGETEETGPDQRPAFPPTRVLELPCQPRSIAVFPRGSHFLVCYDRSAPVRSACFDAATGEIVADVPAVDGESGYPFSPDGRLLVGVNRDREFLVWDTESRRELFNLGGRVEKYLFSPAGDWLALVRYTRPQAFAEEIVFYDLRSGDCFAPDLPGLPAQDRGRCQGLSFSPDGRRFAISVSHYSYAPDRESAYVYCWELVLAEAGVSGRLLSYFPARLHADAVLLVSNDTLIVWGVQSVSLFDVRGGKIVGSYTGLNFRRRYYPGAEMLIVDDQDGLAIWDAARGERYHLFRPGDIERRFDSFSISSDGRYLVAWHGFHHYPDLGEEIGGYVWRLRGDRWPFACSAGAAGALVLLLLGRAWRRRQRARAASSIRESRG